MLYPIFVVSLALWLFGSSMSVGGNLLPAVLVIAALLVYSFFSGRRRLT